jgi:hypothetical protein
LHIQLLGGFGFHVDEGRSVPLYDRKQDIVFAYLALDPERAHPRRDSANGALAEEHLGEAIPGFRRMVGANPVEPNTDETWVVTGTRKGLPVQAQPATAIRSSTARPSTWTGQGVVGPQAVPAAMLLTVRSSGRRCAWVETAQVVLTRGSTRWYST